MKYKKTIVAGLASIALFGSNLTVVNAVPAPIQLITKKDTYTYNSKGKKVGKIYYKGWWFDLLGTKQIKGKQYYRVGKNKYVRASKVRKYDLNVPEPDYDKPITPKWQSKHLVDTSGNIYEQTKKAYELQGEDRIEAIKEIANEKQVLNTSTGEILGGLEDFESKIKNEYYVYLEAITGKPVSDNLLK